jgi:WD40 repeat protein/transcriptional regulator with XRE-family HTH domain
MQELPPWARRLRRERDLHQWTQVDVARQIDTDSKTVGRWERGEARPSYYYGQKLCSLFGKTPAELGLLEESDNDDSDNEYENHVDAVASFPPDHVDLREAPNIEELYGRHLECFQLAERLLNQECRVAAVLGTGGIGKTALVVTVAKQIQHHFDFVFWHSLKDAPPLKDVLRKCLFLLSQNQLAEFPKDTKSQIALLIEYLRQERCLLILDNMETLLLAGSEQGAWREGYTGYGRLLKRLCEVQHQSCLILTSRERPKEISTGAKEAYLLELKGLDLANGSEILQHRGITGTKEELGRLVALYSGNPLSLRLIAGTIHDLFGGDSTSFLREGTSVFGIVQDSLESQFLRLSQAEQEVLYWLAIEREPISLDVLRADTAKTASVLMRTLTALFRRYMIENSTAGFTLQPVIMEYITNELVDGVCKEFEAEKFDLLAKYALIKAKSKDYIRESQTRLILTVIARQLLENLTQRDIETKIDTLLSMLRKITPHRPNYVAGNLLNLLITMKFDVHRHDFSSLYIRQAYLAGQFLPDVDFSHAHFESPVFTDTFGYMLSIAFNARGNLMATGANNCELRIWQLNEGPPCFICQGHAHWIWSVAFSPDGNTVVSGSEDHSIRLWDARTGHCYSIIDGQAGWIFSVAFHPDGQRIAVGGEDHHIRIWNTQTKTCLATLQGHTGWVLSVAFSPDGNMLASGSQDSFIRLWHIQTGTCLQTFQGHGHAIRSIAFSPDGKTLISGSADHTVRLWDVQTGTCLKILASHSNGINAVAFSPDGNTLVSGSADQVLRLWHVQTGTCLKTFQGHSSPVRAVAFHPNGKTIVSSSEDQSLRFWDVESGDCFKTVQGYTNGVVAIAINPTGILLATGSEDKIIRLWDTRTGRCLHKLQGHTNWVWAVAFNPRRPILASGSEDQTIRLWDVRSERCLAVLIGHTNRVGSVAFHPQGHILVSGSNDQTVRLWDITTEQCLAVLEGHTSRNV